MTIVLIDDSKTNLAVMRHLSGKISGSECVCFTDGKAASAYLSTNAAQLIIVDYSMPGMTGIELIKMMRASSNHRSTPIVMVTSSSESAVRKRALEVGATDFLTKPVDAADFSARIKKLVQPTSLDHKAA